MATHWKDSAAYLHTPCITLADVTRIRNEGSVRERAFAAADLASGAVRIHGSGPGMSQALAPLIMNSTPLNVGCAAHRSHLRAAILAGTEPLRPVPPSLEEFEEFCTSLTNKEVDDLHDEIEELVVTCEEVAKAGDEHLKIELNGAPPSDGLLVRLAKMVGADAWLRAGVAADL
jgi:hypothetical protein